MRTLILSIYFHSDNKNTYSSKDFHYYQICADFYQLRFFIKSARVNIKLSHYTSDEKIFIINGYVENCNENLIKSLYNDYYISQAYARELIKDYYSRLEKIDEKKYESLGYVNYKHQYPKPLNDLIGHLPMEIILSNLDYLGSGVVFAYFGASTRTFWMDDIIKEEYMKSETEIKNKINQFLNHSRARHWMDNMDYDMDHDEFRTSFNSQISSFVLEE